VKDYIFYKLFRSLLTKYIYLNTSIFRFDEKTIFSESLVFIIFFIFFYKGIKWRENNAVHKNKLPKNDDNVYLVKKRLPINYWMDDILLFCRWQEKYSNATTLKKNLRICFRDLHYQCTANEIDIYILNESLSAYF